MVLIVYMKKYIKMQNMMHIIGFCQKLGFWNLKWSTLTNLTRFEFLWALHVTIDGAFLPKLPDKYTA